LLSDSATPADKRVGLLQTWQARRSPRHRHAAGAGRAHPARSRNLDVAAEELSGAAAAAPRPLRRPRPHPRPADRRAASGGSDSLTRLYGRPISLQVELDPDLLGGLVVRVGGELIDGSVAGRAAAASLPS
jgi:F-type H+-transporting ATPase subunit delta